MAIKADKWIRRMALEHRMIEPFIEEQVSAGLVFICFSNYSLESIFPKLQFDPLHAEKFLILFN